MKRILWLSNFLFAEKPSAGSGTWIEAIGKGLAAVGGYELYNVTLGAVRNITRRDACGLTQWVLPYRSVRGRAMIDLPSRPDVESICRIAQEVRPHLVHVWGTERFWGLLTARQMIRFPALLEMQGITSALAPYLSGCLTQDEICSCRHLKEWLCPVLSIKSRQRQFASSADREREMFSGHSFIDYQSEWVKSYIDPHVKGQRLFKTRMCVRREFLECTPWSYKPRNHCIFSYGSFSPNKGLHFTLRATSLLRRLYPDIRLEIAGGYSTGLRRSGYLRWLLDEVRRLGLEDCVSFLGAQDANGLVQALRRSAVMVNASLCESYSMSLAEAMAVGCPCVACYAGAMPEVGGDACLYVPVADAGMLASRIQEVFEMKDRAQELGSAACARSRKMHGIQEAVDRQCEIYEEICGDDRGGL